MTPSPKKQQQQQQQQQLCMHKHLLHLTPHHYERHFFAHYYRGIDIFTCTVIPIFLVAYLVSTPGIQAVTAVWYCTLAVRGYRLVLMLLPSAQKARAYEKYRYPLVVTERLLQQLVTTLLLTTGAHGVRQGWEWLDWVLLTTNARAFHAKILMVGGGVTYVVVNTFWLPLNIVTQVVLNTLWFCAFARGALTLVGFSMSCLARSSPWLVWAQWVLECAVASAAQGASSVAALALGSSGSKFCVPMQDMFGLAAARQQQQLAVGAAHTSPAWWDLLCSPADAVTAPAGPASDVASTAGRLSLALATTYMLFVVWFLPLFLSWLLERHLKAKLMRLVANAPQQQQQPKAHADAAAGRAAVSGASAPPKALPLGQVLRLLLLSFVGCFLAAEVFVGLCVQFPGVLGVLKQLPLVYEVAESSL